MDAQPIKLAELIMAGQTGLKVVEGTGVVYVCVARPSRPNAKHAEAVWQVRRIATAAGVTTVVFADGDTKFDNIATDPTALTYPDPAA